MLRNPLSSLTPEPYTASTPYFGSLTAAQDVLRTGGCLRC